MKSGIPSFAANAASNLYNRYNAAGREFKSAHIRPRREKIKEIEKSRGVRLSEEKHLFSFARLAYEFDHFPQEN